MNLAAEHAENRRIVVGGVVEIETLRFDITEKSIKVVGQAVMEGVAGMIGVT